MTGRTRTILMNLSSTLLWRGVRFFFRCLPKKIQTWIDNWITIVLVCYCGCTLVPEKALEKKFRDALRLLIKEFGTQSLGDYLEFGVGFGTSMACMYHALKELELKHVRIFGFDSFKGLPDSVYIECGGIWYPKQFQCDTKNVMRLLKLQGVKCDQITLIRGWFRNTLNDDPIRKYNINKASIIMIDCDLYTSAKEALNFCASLITDIAIIFFDDWYYQGLDERNMGEKRAFTEFLNENPHFTVETLSSYHPNAKVLLVKRILPNNKVEASFRPILSIHE